MTPSQSKMTADMGRLERMTNFQELLWLSVKCHLPIEAWKTGPAESFSNLDSHGLWFP